MSMKFAEAFELITKLGAESKTVLRLVQRNGPITPMELHTRTMFEAAWDVDERSRILADLENKRLIEIYQSQFQVELVRLSRRAEILLDYIDEVVFDEPELVGTFEWVNP